MAKENIKKIIADAEAVEPIAEFNGIKITNFKDGATLRKADAIDDDEPNIANRLMNSDGTVARSNIRYASVNPKKMFDNRYRYIERDGKKILQIVTDKRAISEQKTGSIYLKNVPVYEIERNTKTKQLEVKAVTNVLDTEFVSEFRNVLAMKSMPEVLAAIDRNGAEMTADELGI